MSRLTHFCKQERLLLESYPSLHKLPEFLHTKELFSTANNNQTQEEATKILKLFHDKIRCADYCVLQH
jgi:hypothetical protein